MKNEISHGPVTSTLVLRKWAAFVSVDIWLSFIFLHRNSCLLFGSYVKGVRLTRSFVLTVFFLRYLKLQRHRKEWRSNWMSKPPARKATVIFERGTSPWPRITETAPRSWFHKISFRISAPKQWKFAIPIWLTSSEYRLIKWIVLVSRVAQ
jgi:hypothetical protein